MYTLEQRQLIEQLYAPTKEERLAGARAIVEANRQGQFPLPPKSKDVNNHIHTFYSFSPYTPTAAVFKSVEAGLSTCGLMDHDSIGGSSEFKEACRIFGIAGTQGCEVRCSFAGTSLEGRRTNNPDQVTMTYVALHGVPDQSVEALADFLKPIREARLNRNRAMVERLNDCVGLPELHLDFDRDVMTLSKYEEGGEITERHILYALSLKLIEQIGKGPKLSQFLSERLGLPLDAKQLAMFDDPENPHYAYDLLGLFKAHYVSAFFIPASEECVSVDELAAFTKKHGICLAYAYLGDVTASVTGDKKAQTFEDAYLDELVELLSQKGFNAITYMPSRNTKAQLQRLIGLCERYDFFQISGEDINQPRQGFICEALRDPDYAHLYDMAWALIGHELASEKGLQFGMFSDETKAKYPNLTERVAYFRDLALEHYEA